MLSRSESKRNISWSTPRPSRSRARCRRRSSRPPRPRPTAASRPEFLQPQIEVITSPHADLADARAELRESAANHRRGGGRTRPRHPRRRHPSDRDLAQGAADRESALRQRHERPADDRSARPAVRAARARRAAGPGRAHRCDVPHAALSAVVPRAVDLLAVLAVAKHRAQGLSARRLRRAAAHRRAGAVPHPAGIRCLCGGAGAGRGDRGFELRLVGHPPIARSTPRSNCARPIPAR